MDYPGYVGQRAAFSGKYLYITYAAYNIGWSNWDSYGCDTGLCYDGGVNWLRINDDKNQYGDIRSITGDPRVFGRIYVATGTKGLVYGDIIY